MFNNFKVFKIHVRKVFKNIDIKRIAARELINLE